MTAQIHDIFHYNDSDFQLVGHSHGDPFDAEVLPAPPHWRVTCCWRGYQAVYGILDAQLVIRDLWVNLIASQADPILPAREASDQDPGQPIRGVAPTRPDGGFFSHAYHGINYPLVYTGGLLLGEGFISELYVHMGFHPAWKYQQVRELVFDNGALQADFDRSDAAANLRRQLGTRQDAPTQPPTREEIKQFIEAAFDQSYSRD